MCIHVHATGVCMAERCAGVCILYYHGVLLEGRACMPMRAPRDADI